MPKKVGAIQIVGWQKTLGQKRNTCSRFWLGIRPSRQLDLSAIDTAEIEQTLIERGLSGTVHTGEPDKLTRCNVEIDAAKHMRRPKALENVLEFDFCRVHAWPTPR